MEQLPKRIRIPLPSLDHLSVSSPFSSSSLLHSKRKICPFRVEADSQLLHFRHDRNRFTHTKKKKKEDQPPKKKEKETGEERPDCKRVAAPYTLEMQVGTERIASCSESPKYRHFFMGASPFNPTSQKFIPPTGFILLPVSPSFCDCILRFFALPPIKKTFLFILNCSQCQLLAKGGGKGASGGERKGKTLERPVRGKKKTIELKEDLTLSYFSIILSSPIFPP